MHIKILLKHGKYERGSVNCSTKPPVAQLPPPRQSTFFLTLQHHLWETNRGYIWLWCTYTPYWIQQKLENTSHTWLQPMCCIYDRAPKQLYYLYNKAKSTRNLQTNNQPNTQHMKNTKPPQNKLNPTKLWYQLNFDSKEIFQKKCADVQKVSYKNTKLL